MPPGASRRVLSASCSACLILSVTLTAAAPAMAGDTRAPEVAFAGEVITSAQTELYHGILLVDEVIDPTSIPAPSAFELYINGEDPVVPSSVALS